MKHLSIISRTSPVAPATSTLSIKLDGIIQILDRVALAQLQSAWKAPFPVGGSNDSDSNSSSNSSTDTNSTL
jgi:hypothetical protein